MKSVHLGNDLLIGTQRDLQPVWFKILQKSGNICTVYFVYLQRLNDVHSIRICMDS